ncbi:MAG: hypothetical protein KGN02_05160 [bacterium]|nr:hypothetical protein [bacterium]
MRVVGVTGATGFIGSSLLAAFLERGWGAVAFGRRALPDGAARGITARPYVLGDDAPDLTGLDLLVHCAYDPQADNVAAAAALVRRARAEGVPRVLFVSSLSAQTDAGSAYGREKAACERSFDAARDLIVRPGLVIGNGGLFARMRDSLRRMPLAPVVDGGRQPVYGIGIDDLAGAIVELVEAGACGSYVLASPEPLALRELLRAIARGVGRGIVLVPVPYALLLACAAIVERLRLPLDLGVERVRSLRNLRAFSVPSYPEIARPFASLPSVLAALA